MVIPALPEPQNKLIEHGMIVKPQRRTTKKSQNIFTWIRQRTSPFCFGVKTRAGKPAHCNRNVDVLAHFRSLRAGRWGRHLSRLSNADMADHFAGRKTYYFTADGRCSTTDEVLVNIDIDCHRSGTLAGALAFARHLRATRFPGLYFEASTNGKGVHGYVVVVKGDLGDIGLNPLLTRLDRELKAELVRGNWDVEGVEVKGHAPEFGWGRHKYELLTYKSGQLAKLPREAVERADELRATTRVSADELRRVRTSAVPGGKTGKTRVSGQLVNGVATRERVGSVDGRHFGQEELARLEGAYRSLAKEILGEGKLVASNRKVVTREDLAIFLMLLRFFSGHMNADGSLPTARWREMWTALHEAGGGGRPWCHRRYAAMRNFLSGQGLLAWDDEGYLVGETGRDGRRVPGKASRWRAGTRLMGWMEEGAATPVGCVDLPGGAEKKGAPRAALLYLRKHEGGRASFMDARHPRT